MPSTFILAVDVGAGSLRAGLVRTSGRVEAAAAIPLAFAAPRRGWAELDPERWWLALRTASARVLRALPRSGRVLAVCICGLTRTQVLLDRRGRTVGPAIAFRDARAAGIARELSGTSAFDAAARLAWIERHQPGRFARIDAVAEPKDFLNYRLCGMLAGDSVTSSRPGDARWTPRKVVAPWHAIGEVRAAAPPFTRLTGVPVFAGAMDTWAAAVGSGAVRPGQAYDVAGTSEAIGLVTGRAVTVPGLVSLAWTEDAHQVGGPTQAGADCVRWCHAAFRVRDRMEVAVERVARGPLRAHAPVFLPYLAGERAPVWNSDVRAAFHGIGRDSGPDDFLWSTLEGVAMAVRDILDRAQAGAGVRASALHVSGGGARSAGWCRMKADVTGIPVVRSAEEETGLVGAAIAAAVGLALHPSVEDAAASMVARVRRFAPDPRRTATFSARFAQYGKVKDAALALAGET